MRSTTGRFGRALALVVAVVIATTAMAGVSSASTAAPEAPEAAASPAAPAAPEAPAAPQAPQAPEAPISAAQAQATQTKVLNYGPFTAPGVPDNPDGTHGHAHTGNQFAFGVQKPCENCYITSMKADLRYADGTQAGYATNHQLHHMVMFNSEWGKVDPTCFIGFPFPLGLMFGQRFFASGDERTTIDMPAGYGYKIGQGNSFNLIYELMSMREETVPVTIQMTYEWVPASTAGMKEVEPIWLDVAQCGFSTVNAPAGPSQNSWTWTANRPGKIVRIGGHIHDGGIRTETRNDTTGQVICNSVAGYGESPLYVDHHGDGHLSSMSKCTPTGAAATVRNGDRVTIRGYYDMPAAVTDQMNIVMAFIAAS